MLGDDLEAWLAESYILKRSFKACAQISGLVEKNHIEAQKSGRQVTVSTDLIYDVLQRHEPGHLLLDAAWTEASARLTDLDRLRAIDAASLPTVLPNLTRFATVDAARLGFLG